ncbi:MAG: dTDP-4-dehydrorhamnose reductase [Anaerolineae bacterium]|nr:dTDP-4-dehydrorhamnose reductase [Anaerolineae bacterium]
MYGANTVCIVASSCPSAEPTHYTFSHLPDSAETAIISRMRIFIIGAKGQLGTALTRCLNTHTLTLRDLPELDMTDRAAVSAEIDTVQPDLLINAAAYTNVDGCAQNPQLAYRVNGLGPQNLALACAEHDIPLVHVSTNEVFPGRKAAGYDEWDTLEPVNPYGRSKVAGEHNVRALWRKHYIVRTAWLYAPGGRNFIHAILRFARERGAIRVVTDEIGNPTNVADLAAAIKLLMTTGQYGTYHFVNSGACSRWEFANEILRLADLENVLNEQILSSEFDRASTPPPLGALNNNVGAAIGIALRPWQVALADYFRAEALDS